MYIGAARVVCLNQLTGIAPLNVAVFSPRFTLSLFCHIEDKPIEIFLERGISLLHVAFIYLEQREQSFLGMLELCKQDYAVVIMLLFHNLLYTCFSCDMSGGFSDQIIYSEVSFERR